MRMTENIHFDGISDDLIPLYTAKTAHESFRLGLEMLKEADPEQQLILLRTPAFVSAIQGAIGGIDEGQKSYMEALADVLDSNIRREFYKIF